MAQEVRGVAVHPLAVLAWGTTARDQAAAGALDTLATEVSYPWPSPVAVRAVR